MNVNYFLRQSLNPNLEGMMETQICKHLKTKVLLSDYQMNRNMRKAVLIQNKGLFYTVSVIQGHEGRGTELTHNNNSSSIFLQFLKINVVCNRSIFQAYVRFLPKPCKLFKQAFFLMEVSILDLKPPPFVCFDPDYSLVSSAGPQICGRRDQCTFSIHV